MMFILKENLKAMPKKSAFLWLNLIQAVESQIVRNFFLQNVYLITKYLLLEKIAFSLHYFVWQRARAFWG